MRRVLFLAVLVALLAAVVARADQEEALRLADEGWIALPLLFAFVMGQKGAMPASPKNLLFLSETVPSGSQWLVAGHGGCDLHMSSLAMLLGGHARAGFEDNA